MQKPFLEKLKKQESQLEKENENLLEEHEEWQDKVRKAKKQNIEKQNKNKRLESEITILNNRVEVLEQNIESVLLDNSQ